MAHEARGILTGIQTGEICFSYPEFHKRAAVLMCSRNASKEDIQHAMLSMKKKK